MRIGFISTMGGGKWGGSEELWSLVANEVVQEGHSVFLSVYEGVESPRLTEMQKKGAVLHYRPLAKKALHFHEKVINKAKEKLALRYGWDYAALVSFKPDRLCINLAGSYDILYSPELRELIRKLNIPYSIICQGHDDIPFATEEYRKTVSDIFLAATWVAFVSAANFRSAQRHFARRIPNGFVVNNPANLSSIDILPYPGNISPIRFANVSRLDARQKGHDLLFEALSQPKWKSRNWTLTLAGSGVHEKYLKELVSYYSLQDKVIFAGQVADLRQFWADHHVLLLPSRYEGTPLALIEAMLCGRTAVVTDVAGNTEWINNEIGFIAEAPASLYFDAAMERMWNRHTSLEELGRSCHDMAMTLFDPDVYKMIAGKLVVAPPALTQHSH